MMTSIQRLGFWSVAIALASVAGAAACASRSVQPKVVFLRDTRIVTADESGANVRELVADGQRKADPQWSPQGDHIVYRTAAGEAPGRPQQHAHLVVIRPDGGAVGTVTVRSTEDDGTTVGGMRFVERSGWHGDGKMFAWGSVGPRSSEYRVLDLSGRVLAAYFGTDFATCAPAGTVAHVVGAHDPSRRYIAIDGARVYAPTDRDVAITSLQWTLSCSRLAVHESSVAGSHVVVLRNGAVEARLPLVAATPGAQVVPSGDSFVVRGVAQPLEYDTATRSLKPAPPSSDAEPRTKRAAMVQNLGGRAAHWWSPPAGAPGR